MAYGLICEFDSAASLYNAAKKVVSEGYTKFDTYSPFPIHGIDKAMGLPASKLPWIALVGGILGCSAGFGLQTWVATSAYKLTISGKPLFSYQAFVPVTFELMILLSAFGTVFGMFALNKLPQPYHPVFHKASFAKVTSHSFFLTIESSDAKYDKADTAAFLEKIGGTDVSVLKD